MMPAQPATEPPFPPAEATARLALSNSGFVFDPVSGASYTVNPTGLAVLRALQEGCSRIDDLVRVLGEEFEAPHNVLERDVIEFAGRLRETFRGALK
ncbi:MAG: PqqD family protein [Pseudomonadota bacterium]|nr:PqqD family protein [Pseudomonadota bacterium]